MQTILDILSIEVSVQRCVNPDSDSNPDSSHFGKKRKPWKAESGFGFKKKLVDSDSNFWSLITSRATTEFSHPGRPRNFQLTYIGSVGFESGFGFKAVGFGFKKNKMDSDSFGFGFWDRWIRIRIEVPGFAHHWLCAPVMSKCANLGISNPIRIRIQAPQNSNLDKSESTSIFMNLNLNPIGLNLNPDSNLTWWWMPQGEVWSTSKSSIQIPIRIRNHLIILEFKYKYSWTLVKDHLDIETTLL